MNKRQLPTTDEILYAISEPPLGEGEEAKVYKVHMRPEYTVRVSQEVRDYKALAERIITEGFTPQDDIFEGRNFAQSVAYLGLDDYDKTKAYVTINNFAPGYSPDVDKDASLTSEGAFVKEYAVQKAIVQLPFDAFIEVVDMLHFLSSKKCSLDVGNGGWFVNMGNILLNGKDKKFSIIDVQPFLREHPGINMAHTKGFNTPLYLVRGMIIGSRKYAEEHSKNKALIDLRTETIDKVISACEIGHLNDLDGYLKGNMDDIAYIWKRQLSKINIDEKYQENFIKRLCSIENKNPYPLIEKHPLLVRVSGRSYYS